MGGLYWGRTKTAVKINLIRHYIVAVILGSITICLVLCGSMSMKNEFIQVNTILTNEKTDENISVEPFGYFQGEWNIWEYIGDLVSSLIADI